MQVNAGAIWPTFRPRGISLAHSRLFSSVHVVPLPLWPLDSVIPLEEEGTPNNIPGGIFWFK
jgi:hypothetical protein